MYEFGYQKSVINSVIETRSLITLSVQFTKIFSSDAIENAEK